MRRYYKVADFSFAVSLAGERDPDVYLGSFRPFECAECAEEDKLFELCETESLPMASSTEFLEEDRNDMGNVRLYRVDGGYRVDLSYADGDAPHVFETDSGFACVRAAIWWDDRYVTTALSSMLRIAFSQAVLDRKAVSMHASVVVNEGKAFMFMGKSGTGKSTHSRLWIDAVSGTELLNDDNPIVRVFEDRAVVYGSPWSGKTPCYRNESAPLAGMIRLKQAPHNRFVSKEDIAAFSALLPGCSVLRHDERLHESLCMTLSELVEKTCVGEMECLPDRDAALVCREGILNDDRNKSI